MINMNKLEIMLAEYGIDIKNEDGKYKDGYILLSELADKIFNKVEG